MGWVDALGWFGSALLIYSLLQARILRLRVLNTVACLILIVFNLMIGVWPMVAMNVVLAAINLFFIIRLLRERTDDQAYAVLPVREDDTYLAHFLLFIVWKLLFVDASLQLGWAGLAGFVAALAVLSAALYHGLEKPAQRWLNHHPPGWASAGKTLPAA